jgi:hypothetical protein
MLVTLITVCHTMESFDPRLPTSADKRLLAAGSRLTLEVKNTGSS